jgi:hypothetical protein
MTEMSRRQIMAVICAVPASGCLRLSSEGETGTADSDGGQSSNSETTTGDGSETASGIFPAEDEAIDRAAQFTREAEVVSLGTGEQSSGEGIAFPSQQGGTSSTDGPDGSQSTSTGIEVTPSGEDAFQLGGQTGRAVQVRNRTLDTTATFTPSTGDSPLQVTNLDIEQFLEPDQETPSLTAPAVQTQDSEEVFRIDGSWDRNGTVFAGQAFARYQVALVEDGSVVARTGSRVFGVGYQWAAEQTADTLYITRQPSVRSDWYVSFVLGSFGNEIGTVAAEHVPEQGVFEVNLTELNADAGQYNWTLRFKRNQSTPALESYLRLGGSGLIVR